VQSKLKDKGRICIWAFLAVMAMSQVYVVQELLVAFAVFVLAFAAVASVVLGLYLLPDCWALAAARFATIRRPVMHIAAVVHENQKAA
jgi:hypothetical protein